MAAAVAVTVTPRDHTPRHATQRHDIPTLTPNAADFKRLRKRHGQVAVKSANMQEVAASAEDADALPLHDRVGAPLSALQQKAQDLLKVCMLSVPPAAAGRCWLSG